MSRLSILLVLVIFFISCTKQKHDTEKPFVKAKPEYKKEEFTRGQEMSDPKNILETKTETLELEYIVFGCTCANWIKKEDLKKDNGKLNMEHYFFIEPASAKLELPIKFDAFKNRIRVTGQFYKNKDYPKGTIKGEENLERAKVFRYSELEVINK